MSLLLAALSVLHAAQIGPAVSAAPSPSPVPPEIAQRRAGPPPAAPDFRECLALAEQSPLAAIELARPWRASAQGAARVQASHCLGAAYARLGRWQPALVAFGEARDGLAATEHAYRARLGAMAGNAALATGSPDAALTALDTAQADAGADAAGDAALAGEIALDRGRALVALGRLPEAETALEQARTAAPGSAQAWLLSATLARRLGKLGTAQQQIERAADLLPTAPEIGLEAGVIAVLSGREGAARRSWQSVIGAAPDSPEADMARGYLAQLAAPAR